MLLAIDVGNTQTVFGLFDGDALSAALGQVGVLEDSPRGPWAFDGQSPRQMMYLRAVEGSPDRLSNVVVAELGQKPQVPVGAA